MVRAIGGDANGCVRDSALVRAIGGDANGCVRESA